MNETNDRVKDLIRQLSHRNEDIRWAAAASLATIGEPAVGQLLEALDDRDSVVRLRAAWALGRIGDQRATEKLIRTLGDGDWSVRMRAAQALGNLRARPALDALLLATRDGNADVRRHVIGALSRIADPAAADRLGTALKDKDWRVRMAAALALSAIDDGKSQNLLKAALCDENEHVRTIARAGTRTPEGETCRKTISAGLAGNLPPGTMKVVQDGGREILVANTGDGIYAIGNICTHKGCQLSRGTLEGVTVHCPCHGSAFAVKAGSVVQGPAQEPVTAYPVAITDGEIRITT